MDTVHGAKAPLQTGGKIIELERIDTIDTINTIDTIDTINTIR